MDYFENVNKLKKQYIEEGKQAVKESFKQFFEEFPQVRKIVFAAYRPYFNDGNACDYSVGDFYIFTEDRDEDVTEEEENSDYYNCGIDSYSIKDVKLKEKVKALEKIPSDIAEDVFGDDALVVVTKEGFDVSFCEHE